MMIFRAIDLAYREGQIDVDFFLTSDDEAISYLAGCNDRTSTLVQRAMYWSWYEEVFAVELPYATSVIGNLAEDSGNRGVIADLICEDLGLEPEDVCVYVGKGKERRRVTIPFISADGEKIFFDDSNGDSAYRFRVFANPELEPAKLNQIGGLAGKIATGNIPIV